MELSFTCFKFRLICDVKKASYKSILEVCFIPVILSQLIKTIKDLNLWLSVW